MQRGGCVYIVSNKGRTVYYIGVTADLIRRIRDHKSGEGSVFTKKYNCTDLIYYEYYSQIEEAIAREKRLKKWKRAWKEELIKKLNPDLKDLYLEI
ncbi:MAG: GIY-YIG nuclease family protein [Bacteroidota bacterium]